MRLALKDIATDAKRSVDKGLLVTFAALLLTGLVVLYAASYYNAQDGGSSLADVYSQLL